MFIQQLLPHYRVSTTPGNLLEFTGPPGNFGVRWSTALVSGHKTGHQIAYLSRNWSPYFCFLWPHGVLNAYHVFVLYLAKLHCNTRFGTGRSSANVSWVFLEIPPGILLEFCSVKFVDTLSKQSIANSLLSLTVKEFLKSVKIWQSYYQSFGGLVFWNTVYCIF